MYVDAYFMNMNVGTVSGLWVISIKKVKYLKQKYIVKFKLQFEKWLNLNNKYGIALLRSKLTSE